MASVNPRNPQSNPPRQDGTEYYSDVFDRVSSSSGSLEDLYRDLIGNNLTGNNLSTGQREDLIKQSIDSFIAKKQLDEERAYNNPSAALDRLMAAGMSKDAALQAIAGGAGVGSSGSSLVGSSQSPAPSESYANEVAAKTNIATSVFQAVSCAANVASFGLSVPGQIANNTIAQVSAKATSQAQTALEGINVGVNALNACVSAGLIDQNTADQASRSARTLNNALELCAKKDPNSPAAQFLASDQASSLSSPFAEKMANQRYIEQRSADDYAVDLAYRFDALHGAQVLQQQDIEQGSLMIARLMQENANLLLDGLLKDFELNQIKPEEVMNMRANRGLVNAQIQTEKARRRNINAQTRLTFADIAYRRALTQNVFADTILKGTINNLTSAQAGLAQQQYAITDNILSSSYNGQTGLQWLTQAKIGDYCFNALKYATMNGTEYQKSFQEYLLKDADFLRVNALFRYSYENDAFSSYLDAGSAPYGSDQSIMKIMRSCKQIYSGPYYGNTSPMNNAAGNAVGTAIGAMLRLP